MNLQIPPAAVGIDQVDLKAAAATQYTSNVLDLSKVEDLLILVDVALVGGATAGAAKLTLLLLDENGVNTIRTKDIAAGISSSSANVAELLLLKGIFTANGATAGTAPETLGLAQRCKLRLEVTVASDAATSAKASVHILAKGRAA